MSLVFKKQSNPKALGSGGNQLSSMVPKNTPPDPRYLNVYTSKGGHEIRIDDTPENENIIILHKSGAGIYFGPEGEVKISGQKEGHVESNGPLTIRTTGEYNLVVEGGKCAISSIGGEITLVADSAIAITAKDGPLKLRGKSVEIDARDAVRVSGQSVDIFASGSGITLPTGIMPVLGGLAVRYVATAPGLRSLVPPVNLSGLNDAANATNPTPTPEPDPDPGSGTQVTYITDYNAGTAAAQSLSIGQLTTAVGGLIKTVGSLATTLNGYIALAQNISAAANIAKGMLDSKGEKVIPEIDQPEELPLMSPLTYVGVSSERVALRDRIFDTEEDVNDSETYTAHVNVCQQLGDFTEAEKDLPGEVFESDETEPDVEPLPRSIFPLENGTISCTRNSLYVEGADTKFTEDLSVGQTLLIEDTSVVIAAIESDTRLVLKSIWNQNSVAGVTPQVYRFRSFEEFYKTYSYSKSTRLGTSDLTLADMFVNFVPPVIEPETTFTSLASSTGASGSAGGSAGPEPNTSGYIIPVGRAEEIMRTVFESQGWSIGSGSSRDQRNEWWEAATAVLHFGHPRFNSTPDDKWCVKDAGAGRPQSDDIIARIDTRDAWDLVGNMGGDGASWGRGYVGKLGSEQNIYAPSRSALNRIR